MFSANITNRDPAEILLKNTADREFPLVTMGCVLLSYNKLLFGSIYSPKTRHYGSSRPSLDGNAQLDHDGAQDGRTP